MVNVTASLISLSDLSLLVYRNSRDFCALIFYPATLPNALISYSSFFGGIFRIIYVYYHVICKQWQFYFFFSICIPFISFSSLIALARTSKTMFNKSGKIGHPCLVPDLKGNVFSFSPLRMMLAVGLSYMAFIMFFCFALFLILFIYFYFWLHWVFVAAHRLSDERGLLFIVVPGLLIGWILFLQSTGSRRAGFSSCGTQAQ